jgi:hypothetical protein
MALVVVLRLAFAATPADLFVGGRLNYPVTYFTGWPLC